MVMSGSLPSRERFLANSRYLDFCQVRELCTQDFCSGIEQFDPFCEHYRYFSRVAHADFLNQMLYVDTKTFMVSLNLMVADKTSMASSVETRVPFLDWEFAQWIASNVPPHLKLKGATTKYIYRRALRDMIPSEVMLQRKAGFTAPIDMWLGNDLKTFLRDILSRDRLKRHGIFNPSSVDKLLSEQSAGTKDWSYPIWQILTLELWIEKFMNAKQQQVC